MWYGNDQFSQHTLTTPNVLACQQTKLRKHMKLSYARLEVSTHYFLIIKLLKKQRYHIWYSMR